MAEDDSERSKVSANFNVFKDAATLALQSKVSIRLKEDLPELKLNGFQFETLEAGRSQLVPLFFALHLSKLNLAHIQCPSWLDPDSLSSILLEERQNDSSFAPGLPIFYYEIFRALDEANVESIKECRSVVTRIFLVRSQKIRSKQIIDFKNVGSAEVRFNRMLILKTKPDLM